MTTITTNWQQIGNNEMTNLFLYGQLETPINLENEGIIHHDSVEVALTGVDSFMSVGPGRYANGYQLALVRDFMQGVFMPNNGIDQEMSLVDILTSTSYTRRFTVLQPEYGITDSGFDARSYIYGHEGFAIALGAKFIVKADGVRYIKDYAILPGDEDFDYITKPGEWLQQWGDKTFLEDKIDPSGLGKTVKMMFDQLSKDAYVAENKEVYTLDRFQEDYRTNKDNYAGPAGMAKFILDTYSLTTDLFDDGVTRFLDTDHKPILYGSDGNDIISGTQSRTHVNIADVTHPLRGWTEYGIHAIGGAGNDELVGTGYDDKLFGGDGNDLLEGGKGGDTLAGGTGKDTYVWDTGDGNDTITDADGLGRLMLDGVQLAAATHLQADPANVYRTAGGDTLALDGDTLTVAPKGGGTVTVKHFSQADKTLGIDLADDKAGYNHSDLGQGFIDFLASLGPGGGDWLLAPLHPADNTITYTPDTTNPTLYGTAGNDQMTGRLAGPVDYLFAAAGDDSIYVDGPVGDLSVYAKADSGAAQPWGGPFANTADGGPGEDVVAGGDLADSLGGGAGADILVGGEGADLLIGDAGGIGDQPSDGNDEIVGGAGDDVIFGGGGDDLVLGGSGNDTVIANGGDDAVFGGAGDDFLAGESVYETTVGAKYDDYLDGGAGDDTLRGMAGADTLVGGDGADLLVGDDGNLPAILHGDDALYGGAGDDVLIGQGGADTLDGGAGGDQLFGDSDLTPLAAQGDDYLDGGEGDDYLQGFGGNDTLLGGAGADQMLGDEGDDSLFGEAGDDVMAGGAGNDLLVGGAGIDSISGDGGDDIIDGGDGDDRTASGGGLAGGAGKDTIFGGAGLDELQGGEGDDYLGGEADDDLLFGEAGNDTLDGGAGADELQGGDGDDVLDGGEGNDLLYGDAGADLLAGGAGADELQGGDGGDSLDGGEGDDRLFGQAGDDRLDGGGGNDQLSGGTGADELQGGAGDDVLDGEEGDDRLYGLEGGDTLAGGDGNDRLYGGAGDDALAGGAGDDVLQGNVGVDQLTGGAGGDTFLFGVGDGLDTVGDFSATAAERDAIQFGAGVTADLLALAREGDDLRATVGTGGDQLLVRGYFAQDAVSGQTAKTLLLADGGGRPAICLHGRDGHVHRCRRRRYAGLYGSAGGRHGVAKLAGVRPHRADLHRHPVPCRRGRHRHQAHRDGPLWGQRLRRVRAHGGRRGADAQPSRREPRR